MAAVTRAEDAPAGKVVAGQAADESVMAWAEDKDTGAPRYILQLDEAHRGAKCNCRCRFCHDLLTAVNAGKTTYIKRPHFRHSTGHERQECLAQAARLAVQGVFAAGGWITLPRRRRGRHLEGFSGQFFDAWVEAPAERVRIRAASFSDPATGHLVLDDGRELTVLLIGSGRVAGAGADERVEAVIEIRTDDPALAGMSPEDVLARVQLDWSNECWRRHWQDESLDRHADEQAHAGAVHALDWCADDDLPAGLSASQRREGLLHRAVKEILASEMRIRLPGFNVTAHWRRPDGVLDERTWSTPDELVRFSKVSVEVDLGSAIPDLLIEWAEDGWGHAVLVEVTVTNPIDDERVDRLSSFGFPVLEINVGRMGGRVTREELRRLIVDEVAGKEWLWHPELYGKEAELVRGMKEAWEAETANRRRLRALGAVSAREWGARYLEGVRQRWAAHLAGDSMSLAKAEAEVEDAIAGLVVHGHANAMELAREPLRRIVARLLSIKLNTGVEYKNAPDAWTVINAIRCEGQPMQRWQTLYLIALNVFRPALRDSHLRTIAEWRDRVVGSIGAGEVDYRRPRDFDRLLAVLFPELREALAKPFGTAGEEGRSDNGL